MANSGYQTVYGRSSGGTNGYANLTCTVTTTNGFLLGKDSATSKTRSNVSTGLTGTLVVSVWNSSVDTYADASNKVYPISTIPSDGVTSTVKATSNGAFYALGGHSVSYNLYGEWVCGTKEYF